MTNYQIDIPVLLIFFARPQQTQLVFEQIRIARPSKLYLYQDGPRQSRMDDIKNIEECRKIVQDIDWDCQVYRFYQTSNVGCEPSEFIAQKWMFKNEEYGVVLEDDDVPSQSFFPFCKELLELYKYDERINMICGMNHLGEWKDYPYSYLFTKSGSIWGWASWKRVIDLWDDKYDFLNDKFSLTLLKKIMKHKDYKHLVSTCIKDKHAGKANYESIMASNFYLHSRLNIVPHKNMISNVGVGNNTTHSVSSLSKLPKSIRKIFFMTTYELNFPLTHPKYVIEDSDYKSRVDRIMGKGLILIYIYRKVEGIFYRSLQGDFSYIQSAILKIKKLFK